MNTSETLGWVLLVVGCSALLAYMWAIVGDDDDGDENFPLNW